MFDHLSSNLIDVHSRQLYKVSVFVPEVKQVTHLGYFRTKEEALAAYNTAKHPNEHVKNALGDKQTLSSHEATNRPEKLEGAMQTDWKTQSEIDDTSGYPFVLFP